MGFHASSEGFVLEWHLENFISLFGNVSENVYSPVFEVRTIRSSRWKLELGPVGSTLHGSARVPVSLHRTGDDGWPDSLDIMLDIEVADSRGTVLLAQGAEYAVDRGSRTWVASLYRRDVVRERDLESATIRCRMRSLDGAGSGDPEDRHFRTQLHGGAVQFDRTVENFNLLLPGTKIVLETPPEAPVEALYFHFTRYERPRYESGVTFEMYPRDTIRFPVRSFTCKIWVVGEENCPELCGYHQGLYPRSAVWDLALNLSPRYVMDKGFLYLPNSNLRLKFEFVHYAGSRSVEPEREASKLGKMASGDDDLMTGFRQMLQSDKFSDVVMKAGKDTYFVHSVILIARSSFFRRLVYEKMKNNEKPIVIDVSGIDSDTLLLFLHHIYSGTVQDLDALTASRLLVAAETYEARSLIEKCRNTLRSKLSHSNACEVMANLATSSSETRTLVEEFIVQDLDSLVGSAQFKTFMETNPKLAARLMYAHCLRRLGKSEDPPVDSEDVIADGGLESKDASEPKQGNLLDAGGQARCKDRKGSAETAGRGQISPAGSPSVAGGSAVGGGACGLRESPRKPGPKSPRMGTSPILCSPDGKKSPAVVAGDDAGSARNGRSAKRQNSEGSGDGDQNVNGKSKSMKAGMFS